MKQIILSLLALVLLFTFTACTETVTETPPEEPPIDIAPLPDDIPPYEDEDDYYAEQPPIDHLVIERGVAQVDNMQNLELLGLTIQLVDAYYLEDIPKRFTVNYHEFFEHDIDGHTLVIRARTNLWDLEVIEITNTLLDDELVFVPHEIRFSVGSVLAGDPIVIEDYVSRGTFPFSAITFLDENGYRYYFAIIQSQSDDAAYTLVQFANRFDELPEG